MSSLLGSEAAAPWSSVSYVLSVLGACRLVHGHGRTLLGGGIAFGHAHSELVPVLYDITSAAVLRESHQLADASRSCIACCIRWLHRRVFSWGMFRRAQL